MKKNLKWMSAILTLCLCASVFTFAACSDDEEDVTVTYNIGFTEVSSSSSEAMSEIGEIDRTYRAELGTQEGTFSKTGRVEVCDEEVRNACLQAERQLEGKVWHGTYLYKVTNVNTNQAVYSHRFTPEAK